MQAEPSTRTDPPADAASPAPPVVGVDDPTASRVYFPELDGLRFVAFLAVYVFHGGLPAFAGWVNLFAWPLREAIPPLDRVLPADVGYAIRQNGWVGVQLFFILSGYLITTLLLREERRFGRVDLRAFWARRILRIWPLYYLTIVLSFGVLPALDGVRLDGYRMGFGRHLPWFLAFLGNWSMGLLGPAGNDAMSVLWSVCVEEQFYLFVPLLVAWVGRRWRVGAVLGLMAVGVAGRWSLARAEVNPVLFQYSTITQLDTLLAGVLLAMIFDRIEPGERAARWLRRGQWVLYAAILYLMTRPNLAHADVRHKTWDFVLLWLTGAGLVAVATAGHGRLGRWLSQRRVVWLGRISYGLYMYHEIALWLRHKLDAALGWFVPEQETVLTVLAFAATVGMAALSYEHFERRFLALKSRWTRVPSRPV